MINPAPLANIEAVLLDVFLLELRLHLQAKLSWLTTAYGKAQALKRDKDGRTVVYPGVPALGGVEYISMLPDEHLGQFSWFDIPEYDIEDQGRPDKIYRTDASLIVWGDLRRIYPSDWQGRTVENVKNDVITALQAPGLSSGKVRLSRSYDRQSDIYRGYTDTEVENQYMMRPYVAFRLDLQLTFQPGTTC